MVNMHIYIYIPGSSRYVKFAPFHQKAHQKGKNTKPPRSRSDYVLINLYTVTPLLHSPSSHVIAEPMSSPRLALEVQATNFAGMSCPTLKPRPTSIFFLGHRKMLDVFRFLNLTPWDV